MLIPRNKSEILWHLQFVNGALINYKLFIIKRISSFYIFQVGNGEARFMWKFISHIKTKLVEKNHFSFCFRHTWW